MIRIFAFLLACSSAFAGYNAKATLSFNAASGTSTDTNITLYFRGSDNILRTVANGGQVQHTVSHNGITVPADFVLTNDSTCATVTGGYTWGFKTYSATTGVLVGRVLIPSLTTATAVTPTVCINNSAVSTYQGGAVGADFDASVKGSWDYPDGTTLSAVDSSASGVNGTFTNTPTASAGQIPGGAATFVAASSQSIFVNANPAALQITGDMTYECWFNAATLPTAGNAVVLMTKDDGTGTRGPILFINNDGSAINLWGDLFVASAPTVDNLAQTGPVSASTWYHAAMTYNSTTGDFIVYLNGTNPNGVTLGANAQNNPTANFDVGARTSGITQINFFDGQIQAVRVSSAERSGDWILTEYTNQNSPPLIGAFTTLKTSGQFPRIN